MDNGNYRGRIAVDPKFILVSPVLLEHGFPWSMFSNWCVRESRLRRSSLIIFPTFKKTTYALASMR